MELAYVEGRRSRATPGLSGQCLFCAAPMTAKCGQQVMWHWAHRNRRECDPWWENEGPWHRAWKNLFPSHTHEIVAHDALTGERHIADIRLDAGLVIELQHSAMSLAEMRSREAFYSRMIWIVDAAPFRKHISLFDPLPDPAEPFVGDLMFASPRPEWRRHGLKSIDNFDGLMFMRRSEARPDSDMQQLHAGRELAEHFPDTYRGHRLFLWMRPREVWYQTTTPTFLDFGDGILGQLMKYGSWSRTNWCLRLTTQSALVAQLMADASASGALAAQSKPDGG